MEFVKLNDVESVGFDEAWRIYESSFPSDERRSLVAQKDLMRNNNYDFFSIFSDGVLVAMMAVWRFDDFLFLEHFAVGEEFRNNGIGSGLLRDYISDYDKNIILEVEGYGSDFSDRRIKFYEGIGFKLNTFEYVQPAYGDCKNAVPLLLMSYPGKISEDEFYSIRKKLHCVVYGLEKPLVS